MNLWLISAILLAIACVVLIVIAIIKHHHTTTGCSSACKFPYICQGNSCLLPKGACNTDANCAPNFSCQNNICKAIIQYTCTGTSCVQVENPAVNCLPPNQCYSDPNCGQSNCQPQYFCSGLTCIQSSNPSQDCQQVTCYSQADCQDTCGYGPFVCNGTSCIAEPLTDGCSSVPTGVPCYTDIASCNNACSKFTLLPAGNYSFTTANSHLIISGSIPTLWSFWSQVSPAAAPFSYDPTTQTLTSLAPGITGTVYFSAVTPYSNVLMIDKQNSSKIQLLTNDGGNTVFMNLAGALDAGFGTWLGLLLSTSPPNSPITYNYTSSMAIPAVQWIVTKISS